MSDRPFDDAPDELLEQARKRVRARREENDYDELGKKLARRIFVAFALILVTAIAFFVVLPSMGLRLPPIVPIMCFATIAIGAVLTHVGDAPEEQPDPDGPIDVSAVRRERSLPPGSPDQE
ncbi:MAG: hypothetical protein AAGI53_08845 [Planctomycetota bacterium]